MQWTKHAGLLDCMHCFMRLLLIASSYIKTCTVSGRPRPRPAHYGQIHLHTVIQGAGRRCTEIDHAHRKMSRHAYHACHQHLLKSGYCRLHDHPDQVETSCMANKAVVSIHSCSTWLPGYKYSINYVVSGDILLTVQLTWCNSIASVWEWLWLSHTAHIIGITFPVAT